MRLHTLVSVVALLNGLGAGSIANVSGQQTERTGLVSIDVSVSDQKGSRVTGLTARDFELLVDGEPRPIESVAVDDRQVTIALLLDVSASCPVSPADLKLVLAKFWESLVPSDRVRLGLIGSSSARLEPSHGGERRVPTAALKLLDLPPAHTVQEKQLPPANASMPQMRLLERKPTGARMAPSPIWDVVYGAVSALERESGRRAIVLFTDGRATANLHGLDEAVVHALAAGISIHVVSEAEDEVIAVDTSNAVRVRPGASLEKLARATGGSFVSLAEALGPASAKGTLSSKKISDGVAKLFTGALHEARAPYRLTFAPPELDNAHHRIDVRVRRGGLTVRSPSYFVTPGSTSSR